MFFRPTVLRQYKCQQPKISRARDLRSRGSVTTGTDLLTVSPSFKFGYIGFLFLYWAYDAFRTGELGGNSGARSSEQDLTAAWDNVSGSVHLPGELPVKYRTAQTLMRCVLSPGGRRAQLRPCSKLGKKKKRMTDTTAYSCIISVQTKKKSCRN